MRLCRFPCGKPRLSGQLPLWPTPPRRSFSFKSERKAEAFRTDAQSRKPLIVSRTHEFLRNPENLIHREYNSKPRPNFSLIPLTQSMPNGNYSSALFFDPDSGDNMITRRFLIAIALLALPKRPSRSLATINRIACWNLPEHCRARRATFRLRTIEAIPIRLQ
jgi:hypothetical protein